MSDYIPFDIQSEIIKTLPVRSLVQFRCVSKQWKSFIDCPEFIKTYHINHPNPLHHLLLEYTIDSVQTYTWIKDDDTFPKQKFHLTAPEPLNLLRHTRTLGSINGLICFYGWNKDMFVLWNPFIRKSVPIPNVTKSGYTRNIGFGVCPETNDVKLVKINIVLTPSECWEVHVFTLSSRVWKTVYTGAPFKRYELEDPPVCIDGLIYWLSFRGSSSIISFDLKTEKFGEVCIPRLYSDGLGVAKVNATLGLLEYTKEYNIKEGHHMWFCGVWIRKDGVNKPFTKIYTFKVGGRFNRVLGFRNGEVVIETSDDDWLEESQIEVYEPSSGRINSIGISGECHSFSAWSYMETLLLLDE